MSDPNFFWTVFAAVLSALLLAGMFFGSLISYSRLERHGQELAAPLYLYVGMLLPIAFLVAGWWIIGFGR